MSFDMLKTRHDSPALLTWPGPLDVRMREGVHRFIARKAAESIETRQQYWHRDFSSPAAYRIPFGQTASGSGRILGVVDDRLPAALERFGDDVNPALVAETRSYRIFQVRWPVLKNIYDLPVVCGEGLLLEPRTKPVACVVALPDADQTPEQLAGVAEGIPDESQFARRLAENGFMVIVPVLANRAVFQAGHTQREWIYHPAFHMGRHVIGYKVQKTPRGGGLVQTAARRRDEDRRGGIRRRRPRGVLCSGDRPAHRRRAG